MGKNPASKNCKAALFIVLACGVCCVGVLFDVTARLRCRDVSHGGPRGVAGVGEFGGCSDAPGETFIESARCCAEHGKC